MSAGAAYPSSVETMQILGDAQQHQHPQQQQSKQVHVVPQPQQLQQQASLIGGAAPAGTIQLVDGATLVPTESLIGQQQPQVHHHLQAAAVPQHPQMATIVTAAGGAPILVPSGAQPVGPMVTIGPNGAIITTVATPTTAPGAGSQQDYVQMNGTEGGATGAVMPVAGEYYVPAAGQPVSGEVVMQQQAAAGQDQLILGSSVAAVPAGVPTAVVGPVTATSDGTPIPLDQLKQLLMTQLEYYFSR